jgi:hypoxanthine phosphoribosyltransferase
MANVTSNTSTIRSLLHAQMSQFHSNVYSSYFLPFVVVENLKGGVKVGESFRTSLIFLLTVLTTEDTTSLHKSSTEKNDVNGTTIDMLIDDRML